jgi:predicted permease
MRRLRALALRLRALFTGRRDDRDLAAELDSHLQLHADDNIRAGMTPGEARRQAQLKLGGLTATSERYRDRRRLPLLDQLVRDGRFALRQLGRSPGFATAALAVLALGLCASATIIAFVDAALLRPLPYRDASRLVDVTESVAQIPRANLSYADYVDWKRMSTSFSGFDVYTRTGFNWSRPSGLQALAGARVTAGFFRTLGVTPILGRDFHDGEGAPKAPATILLSYDAWQRHFGGRPDVIGESMVLTGTPRTIIGVLPSSFAFAPAGGVEMWAPIGELNFCEQHRGCHDLRGIARMDDHATLASARAEMTSIAANLEAQYPDTNRGQGAAVASLATIIVGDVRPTLLLLLGGVVLLLMIACLNVAGLLLVRTDSRQRELAVRQALGASRGRLFAQFGIEALVLVTIACAIGLGVAAWAVPSLVSLIPANRLATMPYLQHIDVNPRLAMVAIAMAGAAAFVLTMTPFVRMSRAASAVPLAGGARGSSGRIWRRLGSRLVVAELVVAVILLVGAGLLGRSAYRLMHVDLGFNPDGLATIRVAAYGPRFNGTDAALTLHRSVLEYVAHVPGVTSVATTSRLPVSGNGNTTSIRVDGQPYHGERNEVNYRSITASYFDTLGVRQIRGRRFTESDDAAHPRAAIINQVLARQYFGDQDPIGRRIGDTNLTPQSMREIVGVVDDLREGGLEEPIWPAIYFPYNQDSYTEFLVVARTAVPPDTILPALDAAVRETDRDAAAIAPRTMTSQIDESPAAYIRRSTAWTVTAFAAVAWVLGIVGLYGVLAYLVRQRTREIGVRLALGADRRSVSRMVVLEASKLAIVGIAAGLLTAVAMAMSMRALLFNTAPWDMATLVAVGVLLGGSALLASYIPARRAASVNPIEALRSE